MNLIYTKQGLMEMEIEELEKHKDDAWKYYSKVKKVLSFREIEE